MPKGPARAILAARDGAFAARAVTRKPDAEKARALAKLGVEVVAGDADDPPSLDRALAGAYGAYCVTNFWEHFSAERDASANRWPFDRAGPVVPALAKMPAMAQGRRQMH